MKRHVLAAAVATTAIALVAPPVAGAAEIRFEQRGLADAELEVGFTLLTKNDEPKKVKDFEFIGLTMVCDQGTVVLDNVGNPFQTMKINDDGKFGEKFNGPNSAGTERYDVRGDVKKKGKRVEGTLRASGTFLAGDGSVLTNCDSGKTEWVAKRN